MNNYICLDTEFNDSQESRMNVICAVIVTSHTTYRYNLLNNKDLDKFKEFLYSNNSLVMLTYAASAEARSLLSLGINPLDFKWVDLYVEFRMLCNSNNSFNYGNYIDADGNINVSYPPIPGQEIEDGLHHKETPKNLINALYKLCKIQVDSKQKDEMRNLILSKDDSMIHKHIDEILDYCESDTKHLRSLYFAIDKEYRKLGLTGFEKDQLERGRYSVCMAIIENNGLPIDMKMLNRIILKTPEILDIKKAEVNKVLSNYFIPEIQPPPKTFKNGKVFHYKVQEARTDTKRLQTFIKEQKLENWPLTDSGLFKTDRKTLQDYGYIPEIKEILSFNNLDNNLKWFKKDNKDGFFERLGNDDIVRPYYGIFGTQTGRNAAKAKTFPLAMGSWLRCIIQPPKDKVIIGCDFSQQEVYVAAILAKDDKLLEAYNSGDVYLHFGKMTGVIPKEGTKTTHSNEREQFKATVLGKQFGMGIDKLHASLCTSSKNPNLPREAAEKMDRYHKETFKAFWEYTYTCSGKYKSRIPLITSDGWVLWQDNPILTSVRNFMIQGTAASITRKAVNLLVEQGLYVIASLHDAIYVLTDTESETTIKLAIESAMKKATELILNEKTTQIRLDTKVVRHGEVWVDSKGQKDWERLKLILGV